MVSIGRGSWIRTNDPLLPKQMRYQAALYPEYLESTLQRSIVGPEYNHPLRAAQEDFMPFDVVNASQFPSSTRITARPAIAVGS